MKKRDLTELKNKEVKDLKLKVQELRNSIVETRLELKLGRLSNAHSLMKTKKNLAQVLTIINLKDMNQMNKKNKPALKGEKDGTN